MADDGGGTVPREETREPAPRAQDRVRTARPDGAEPRARHPGLVDLLREPPVEADGKRRGHLRAQRARDRALGDDPFDAAVQVAGTEMQDAQRRGLVARHQKRFGTLIVSPAWTSVDSFALISTFLPSTTRSILMLPRLARSVTPPAIASACSTLSSPFSTY